MAVKTILFSILFLCLGGGALINPIYGVLGYILHYIIGPDRQWWHAPLNFLGLRYSFTFAILIAAGIFLNQSQLRFKEILIRQEKLALLMLALIWLLTLFGPDTIGRYGIVDHASIKMTKVMIFCLMMTHVVTRLKDLDKVLWAFVLGSLVLGLQAYDIPRRAFTGGRLDAVIGGSDFLNSNDLAAFMVAATVIIGTVFMRSSWKGMLVCAVAGAFSLNTIVLCRSRGAILALLGAGIAIVVGAPQQYRTKLVLGMVVASLGLLYVSDAQFLTRMGAISKHASSIASGREATDRSAMMRIEAWSGGIKMFRDHPLGVGPGNFNQYIGRYSPSIEGLSPHSTYIQVLAELGLLGLLLLLMLVGNGLWTIRKVIRSSGDLPEPDKSILRWSSCGIGAVIVGYMTSGVTGHFLYFEGFWWFLLSPAILQRVNENAHEDLKAAEE